MCLWVCVGTRMKERKGNLQIKKTNNVTQNQPKYLYIPTTYERPNPMPSSYKTDLMLRAYLNPFVGVRSTQRAGWVWCEGAESFIVSCQLLGAFADGQDECPG